MNRTPKSHVGEKYMDEKGVWRVWTQQDEDEFNSLLKWYCNIGKEQRKALGGIDTVRVPKKIGRNDPCGCGSGKKFKQCCG